MLKRNGLVQDETVQYLIDTARVCTECQIHCEASYHYVADRVAAGAAGLRDLMRLAADCAEVCRMTATLTARHSPLAMAACRFCAKVCDHCAEACQPHARERVIALCAEECRECAQVCREMLDVLAS